MYDTTDVEELNAAQKRLEPNFGNGFIDLDGDETGKERPGHRNISMNPHNLT